ncbi:unnamed protein product [Mycena citricolor]|uniref:mRNA export factor GLE1 n=2 Tax=Mycena citricolor TaxID=2018698 RepID=A0AAD2I079_9AGAR|nr:unnamed protein product [Mycena citricolor]
MRFSVPRSSSTSPGKRRTPQRAQPARRSQSSFGLVSSDSESELSDPESDPDSVDSFLYASESEMPQPPLPMYALDTFILGHIQHSSHRNSRTEQKRHRNNSRQKIPSLQYDFAHDIMTLMRNGRSRRARMRSCRTARKEQTALLQQNADELEKSRMEELRQLDALHAMQMAEVQKQLESLKFQAQKEDDRLRQAWKERDKMLWARIDSVIAMEENKVRTRLDAERKAKEELDRKKQEEEMRMREAAEKQRKETEERKKQAEDEEKKRKDEEQVRAREETERRTRLSAESSSRQALGLTDAESEWKQARAVLTTLKSDFMKPIKSDKAKSTVWGEYRRKITPKIGQLTNDLQAITRITDFIQHQVLAPPQPLPPILYKALLSSLSKAILLQAETEVTAEKKAAIPLALASFRLLEQLEAFPEVFFARLSHRCGIWLIPCPLPEKDHDGRPWADKVERQKMQGFRLSSSDDAESWESMQEYSDRISGMMRLYFHIIRIVPQNKPLHPLFQLPRCWQWLSRLLNERSLLESPVAAQLIYTLLDVMGLDALQVWGQQWAKMLQLIYQGITEGYAPGKLIGGTSPLGIAARSRVQSEVERIVAGIK